jgi:hypothetical protein
MCEQFGFTVRLSFVFRSGLLERRAVLLFVNRVALAALAGLNQFFGSSNINRLSLYSQRSTGTSHRQ